MIYKATKIHTIRFNVEVLHGAKTLYRVNSFLIEKYDYKELQ